MKFSLVTAVFCLFVFRASAFPTSDPRFDLEMSVRLRRSVKTDCDRDYDPDTHICCAGRVHPRGDGPVDCCNGKFYNPSTHVCNGRSAYQKRARKCGPGLQWTNSSSDSEGECQLCPDGYFKSRASESDCQRCHKCQKYGVINVYLHCEPWQNALCDYPWVWENLHRCARKRKCHSHYKHRRGITRKKMQEKLKKWTEDCGRLQKKRKQLRVLRGKDKVCAEWQSMTIDPTREPMKRNVSSLPFSSPISPPETSPSSVTTSTTPFTEVRTTSSLIFRRGVDHSNDSFFLSSDATGPKGVTFKSSLFTTRSLVTPQVRNETLLVTLANNATAGDTEVPREHQIVAVFAGSVALFLLLVIIIIIAIRMTPRQIIRWKSKKRSQGSSCNTLVSNRSSVSSSKANFIVTSAVITSEKTLLQPLDAFTAPGQPSSKSPYMMIPCSTSSCDSGYNSCASKRATLNKDHGSSETTSLLDQNSVPCRESQARPLHLHVEVEQPRCREASVTRHGTSPSAGLSERLESFSGSDKDIDPEQDKTRSMESLDSTNCGLSLASEEKFYNSTDENLDGKTQGTNDIETTVSVQATGFEREGSTADCIQEHPPVALFKNQMESDILDPAPIIPIRPKLLEQLPRREETDDCKRRPLSDPLPRGERHSAAEGGRRHTFPADSSTKLHLRVPPSPDGSPDSEKSDDEEDVDYDEVATNASTDGENDGDAAEELYDDATSPLEHPQVLSESAAEGRGRKPCNIGLITVRNPLCQPAEYPENIQTGSLISTVSADQSVVPRKESADAARSSIDSPPQRKSGVRNSISRRATTSSRSHSIDEAEELHPTGRNPIETLRTTKVKNTNLASMIEEGNVLSSSASTKGGHMPRGAIPDLLQLAKESKFCKENLLTSYSAEMATQTDDAQGKRDLLGGQWQFSGVFSPEGGILQRENSDVRVLIPKDSVPVATKISGSIHTSVSRLRSKLFRAYSDYVLLSPVAEFHASVPVFGKRVAIKIPFVEPGGFKKACFKVMGFTSENNGEITISEVPLLPGSDEDEVNTEGAADVPESYYTFSEPEVVTVHTPHFSGYYCVHCKQNITSGLYAVVFGNHTTTNQLPRVLVRLYVTDGKIMLKDYKEQFIEEEKKAGRSYLDKKEIRLHENIHSRSFLRFLLSPEGDFADHWTFSLRRNGEPRTKNMQVDRLEHMVQCCQKRDPAFVEWLLEGTRAQVGGQPIEFECTVDIWNQKVDPDLLDSNPDSFTPAYNVKGHTVLNVTTQKPQPGLPECFKTLPLPDEVRDQITLSVLSQLSNLNVRNVPQGGQDNLAFPEAPRSVQQPGPSMPQQQQQQRIQATSPGDSPRSTQALAELGPMASDAFPAMPLQRGTTGAPRQDASVNTHPVQEIGAGNGETGDETEVLKPV